MPASFRRYRHAPHWSFAASVATTALVRTAQQQERSAVPDRYKWNLSEIYPSDDAWRAAKEKLVAELPAIRPSKAQLASSPQKLADALELDHSTDERLLASLRLREHDFRPGHPRQHLLKACSRRWRRSAPHFGAETAFVEPEILKSDAAKIEASSPASRA